ncbi:hypothetical protein A3Q40_03255 [Rhodococcus sp. PBTS 1]|nr:hypothetical protein A3Q40_03255 [Rhodococcus sp. PBTS 1]
MLSLPARTRTPSRRPSTRSAVSRPGAFAPEAVPTTLAPTSLRPADLLRLTDQSAADVLDGRHDALLPPGGFPLDERWSARIHSDDIVDLWLISWVPDRSTELHDHAGSLGALTVLSGALSEYRWNGTTLQHRLLRAGDQALFPLGWVHDVTHAPTDDGSAAAQSTPTLSVHAYSPPLTAMSYYDIGAGGGLRRTRTELTDVPEGSA